LTTTKDTKYTKEDFGCGMMGVGMTETCYRFFCVFTVFRGLVQKVRFITTKDTKYTKENIGCWVLGAGCWVLGVGTTEACYRSFFVFFVYFVVKLTRPLGTFTPPPPVSSGWSAEVWGSVGAFEPVPGLRREIHDARVASDSPCRPVSVPSLAAPVAVRSVEV